MAKNEISDVTLHCFVSQVVDAQQAERTTGGDVTEEEPHPYTISFFLFPHKQTVDLIGGKGNKTSNTTQHDKTKFNTTKGNQLKSNLLQKDISSRHISSLNWPSLSSIFV